MADKKAAKRQKKMEKERRRAAERAEKFLTEDEKAQRLAWFADFTKMFNQIREFKADIRRHRTEDVPAYEPWFKENFPEPEAQIRQASRDLARLQADLLTVREMAKAAGCKPVLFCRKFAESLPAGTDFWTAARDAFARDFPEKAAELAKTVAETATETQMSDRLPPAEEEFTAEQAAQVLESAKNEVFLNAANHKRTVQEFCLSMQEKYRAALNARRQLDMVLSWGFSRLDADGREKFKEKVAADLQEKLQLFRSMADKKRQELDRLAGKGK